MSLLVAWLSLTAFAAPDEGPIDTDAPVVEAPAEDEGPALPRPVSIVPAVHPAAALEAGQGAQVVVTLDLSEDGSVLDARVEQPVGDGFDEAVLAVAPGWRFTPATDERGRPVPVQIRYAYVFTVDTAPVVSLEGRARQAGTREPLGGVAVQLTGPEGASRVLRTSPDGGFSAADLDEGTWRVVVTGAGLEPAEGEVVVARGKVAEITLFAVVTRPWEAEAADETVEVVARRTNPEITERVLDADEIRYLPGSNGDVVKAVQNLPGLARPPLGIGQLIVRGTAPEDSAYFVDGIGIPLAFHFGGLATVLPSDTIDEVAFLPGNFGVRYGRVIGGAIDIRTTPTLPERSSGYVSVDVYQANVFAEQKVSERTAVTVSGRRSYADAVLNPILNGMEGVNVQAPRYYDLQARVLHQRPSGATFDVLFLLSDDGFRFLGEDEDGQEKETAEIGLTQGFSRVRARWLQPLGNGWRSETALGLGPSVQTFEFGGEGEAYEKEWAIDLRQEVYRLASEQQKVGWRLGVDARTDRVRFLYDIPGFGTTTREEDSGWRLRPAVYAEPTVRLGRLELVPGLRADAQILGDHEALWLDPRFAGSFRAGDSTRIKLSVGRYSQPPLPRQVLAGGGGTAGLGPVSSLQTSIGVEQQIGPSVSLEVNRFYNWLDDVVVGREDAFSFFTGPPPVGPFDTDAWANEGKGRIAGVEAIVKASTPRLVALASATLSHSVRLDRDGEERLFRYDQPLVVNALASYKLPRRWRLGGRVRFSSGNPYTPVVNRVFDHGSRTFVPIYGERDSARLPPFWSVDIRVDKDWVFDRWTLTAYLDLQNATANQNIEVMGWTYDYSAEDPVTSIPPLPAFGLRAEW